ncbi:MAG TPA: aldehyde dehydrogenase family protein [Conexivisphaerales archaeon]|nr:aldehyde dehydrogenase family protein [Conexivisphaerales archaeon]
MPFRSEATWIRLSRQGREKEFHELYESAVLEAKKELGGHVPLYIGGKEVRAKEEFAKRSPADDRVILAYLQKGDRSSAQAAIDAAEKAYKGWSSTDYKKRVQIFYKAANLMARRKFHLSALMSLENGKNRMEAVGDVDEAIDYLRYYANEMTRNKGFVHKMKSVYEGEKVKSILKPYGVWGIIAPFNFPLAITVGMTSGALVTGNTVVLKPSSDAPLVAVEFCRIMAEAGLPPGVLNLVTGPGGTVGDAILNSPKVKGIAFTGSYDVGARGYLQFSAKGPKPFIAEMGGKNAAIVTSKADLDKAVEGVFRGAFGFGGQKCSATSRVVVFREVHKQFVEKLVSRIQKCVVGDPTRKDVFMGPVINEAAMEKYKGAVADASKDCKILTGGKVLTEGELAHGNYVAPTLVDGIPRGHRIELEELFVPILAVIEAGDLDEAIAIANEVEYGLTGGIFTEDPEEAKRYFAEVQAGVIYWNRSVGATTGAMVGVQSFVGWKHSGSTGKGAGGVYYLPQFLREQCQSVYT